MSKAKIYTCILSLLIISNLTNAGDEPALQVEPRAAAAHVQRAIGLAGSDLNFLTDGFLCNPAENTIPWAIKNVPGFLDPNAPAVEPFAAFDNLYYVGLYAIGAWILDTGDGLILFDALNSEEDARGILVPSMEKLGLDPNHLKYLVISHAHFDHYGGADYLRKKYGVRVMMSEADWDNLPNDIALPYAIKAGYPAITQPQRDLVVEDGYTLTLGDSKVMFVLTPGHTPGTLSTIITIKDRGQARTISMWGGQALHPSIKELVEMHDSLHKFWELGKEHGVEGVISTHAWVTGTFRLHAKGRVNNLNPLIIGNEGYDRFMGIFDECIKAQFARSNSRQND